MRTAAVQQTAVVERLHLPHVIGGCSFSLSFYLSCVSPETVITAAAMPACQQTSAYLVLYGRHQSKSDFMCHCLYLVSPEPVIAAVAMPARQQTTSTYLLLYGRQQSEGGFVCDFSFILCHVSREVCCLSLSLSLHVSGNGEHCCSYIDLSSDYKYCCTPDSGRNAASYARCHEQECSLLLAFCRFLDTVSTAVVMPASQQTTST